MNLLLVACHPICNLENLGRVLVVLSAPPMSRMLTLDGSIISQKLGLRRTLPQEQWVPIGRPIAVLIKVNLSLACQQM